ncbi:MAG: hypothetical protein HGA65_02890, partial [Oscillochloris sp.]|nr:hypothetical protein [Oscillochloris sp.]
MVADETALILVLPGDTADTLLRKIEQCGSRRVQLLVPEGVVGLQQQAQLERLRTLIARSRIGLTLISSDPQTLRVASLAGIEVMQVRDAHVVAPVQATSSSDPYATRALDREPARGGVPHHMADDLSAGDAAFLDALDDLDAMPSARNTFSSAEDEDLFAALESISVVDSPGARRPPSADDDFADSLDSIGADESELRQATAQRAQTASSAPRRIRPEDIELSADEKARASQTGRRTAPPPQPRPARPAPAQPGRRSSLYDDDPTEVAPPAPRRGLLIPALIALILLAAVAIAGFIFLGRGATVSVAAPVRSDQVELVGAMPVPVVAPGSGGGTAVEAEEIESDVAVNVSGQVTEATMAPSGTAHGSIVVYNSSPQPITLPAGSEFVAVKPDGQEVPFVSGSDITLPAAVTTDQGAQIVTTRGIAEVAVTARS